VRAARALAHLIHRPAAHAHPPQHSREARARTRPHCSQFRCERCVREEHPLVALVTGLSSTAAARAGSDEAMGSRPKQAITSMATDHHLQPPLWESASTRRCTSSAACSDHVSAQAPPWAHPSSPAGGCPRGSSPVPMEPASQVVVDTSRGHRSECGQSNGPQLLAAGGIGALRVRGQRERPRVTVGRACAAAVLGDPGTRLASRGRESAGPLAVLSRNKPSPHFVS
jgi:hypothetical protein